MKKILFLLLLVSSFCYGQDRNYLLQNGVTIAGKWYDSATIKALIDTKQGTITFGTGVQTALGVNVGSAGAPVLFNGAGGTPSSLVGTNISGTGASFTAGNATKLTTPRAIYGNNFDGSAALSQIIAGTYGGTGVNNGSKTLTLSGNTTLGSSTNTVAMATSGNTSVTLPTSGTLATITNIYDSLLANQVTFRNPLSGDTLLTNPSTNVFLFKSLVAGTNVTLAKTDTTITINSSGGFSDPLTTNGDIIARVSGTTTRLAQGANGTFLGVSGGTLGYYTPSGSGDMVLASAQTNSGIKTFLNTTMKLRNVANTFDGYFVNTNTADRIYTLKDATGTIPLLEVTNTWTAGAKQIFGASGTTAGVNFAGLAGDPSGLSNGDLWYNTTTGKFRARQAGSSVDLIGGGSSPTTSDNMFAFTGSDLAAKKTPTTLTDGATITWNAQTAYNARVTLGGNRTLDITNPQAGDFYTVTVLQDGTGSRTLTLPGGASAILKTAAGDSTTVSGYYRNGGYVWKTDATSGTAAAGSNKQLQINNSGVMGGITNLTYDAATNQLELAGTDADVLLTGVTTEPGAPASGKLDMYSKNIAGRMMMKVKGPSGIDYPLQPSLMNNGTKWISPASGSAPTLNGLVNTFVGTCSHPTPASTNYRTAGNRWIVTSAATTPSASEGRSAQSLWWRGNAAGLGGFTYAATFAVSSTTTNQQVAVGLWSATGATSTSQTPSALTNCIFVGWDAADANLQVMSNDNSGTCAKVNLGSSFPANSTTAVYEVVFFCAPNSSSIGYRVKRIDTGNEAEASGTISTSTDLPQNTVWLTRHEYMNNSTTAAAVVLEIFKVYAETDY